MHNADPEGPASSTDCSELDQRRNTVSAQAPATHPYRKTARRHAGARPRLVEPIIAAEFWANRRGESVRVQLCKFEGHTILDVRRHYTAADGVLRPTKKGISLAVARLPELAAALVKAEQKARELGLLSDDGGAP